MLIILASVVTKRTMTVIAVIAHDDITFAYFDLPKFHKYT